MGVLGDEAAQVHDSTHSRSRGGRGELLGGRPVLGTVVGFADRMDEVVGDIDVARLGEGRGTGLFVRDVERHRGHGIVEVESAQVLRSPRPDDDVRVVCQQGRHQPRSDVPAGTGHEDSHASRLTAVGALRRYGIVAPMALVLAGVVLPDPLGTETVLRRGAAVARAGVSWMFTTADFALTLPGRIEALLSRIETLMTRIDHVIDSADAVVAHVQRTTGAADTVVASASAASHTALELIEMFDPIAKKSEPMARRFVDNLSDAEVDAAIAMVDQLPGLLDHMEALLPILATLDTVSPEIHELLGVTKDVRRAVIGIPGFKFFRNRGEDKLNDEMEDEQR
ncbi:unannotated protein [freshwater metagenome]|uniref:Unannotated protein n=2 Tax=root TaxID=1 RepID=A0A6J7GG90_9ZZZZ